MVEKMLNIVQCTDREKVLYASSRLEGTAADWWDAYTAAHDTPTLSPGRSSGTSSGSNTYAKV
jgi:hypothetical protein